MEVKTMVALIHEFESNFEEMKSDLKNWKELYTLKKVLETFLVDELYKNNIDMDKVNILKFIRKLEETSNKEYKSFNRLQKYNINKRSEALEICDDMNICIYDDYNC